MEEFNIVYIIRQECVRTGGVQGRHCRCLIKKNLPIALRTGWQYCPNKTYTFGWKGEHSVSCYIVLLPPQKCPSVREMLTGLISFSSSNWFHKDLVRFCNCFLLKAFFSWCELYCFTDRLPLLRDGTDEGLCGWEISRVFIALLHGPYYVSYIRSDI